MPRYSDRLAWSAPPNSFSRLVEERRLAGARLLDLTVSNPTETLLHYPHGAIAQAYGAVSDFTYQPEALGQRAAREQIASWYADRDIELAPERIAITTSTSEAYSLLFKLLMNAGENLLVPTPSYPLFEYLAKLDGVELRPYRLLYDGGWHIDFASLDGAISNATRAIAVVNPNNPTGSFLKPEECERLEAIAFKHALPLIADEVFMDYAFGGSPERVSTLIGRNNVLSFSLNGLSKSAGMPQMKLGWIAVNGPGEECETALERLELLLDTYLPVGTPVQKALGDLLRIGNSIQRDLAAHVQKNREALANISRTSGTHALHGEGGWSAILRVPNVWPEETWITRLLEEQSVIVQPGYFFDMPMDGCLVLSLITEPGIFAEALERITLMATRL